MFSEYTCQVLPLLAPTTTTRVSTSSYPKRRTIHWIMTAQMLMMVRRRRTSGSTSSPPLSWNVWSTLRRVRKSRQKTSIVFSRFARSKPLPSNSLVRSVGSSQMRSSMRWSTMGMLRNTTRLGMIYSFSYATRFSYVHTVTETRLAQSKASATLTS